MAACFQAAFSAVSVDCRLSLWYTYLVKQRAAWQGYRESSCAAVLRREASRLKFDRAVFDLCLNQAVDCLTDAKQTHDALERYYIDAMDYARLDEIKAAFLASLPGA